VRDVIIIDEAKKQALAVVNDSQLSLAIGKQGLNVRLANRLADWDIDVKTSVQFEELGITSETRAAATRLFEDGALADEDEISTITELTGVDEAVAELLARNGIEYIEDFINADDAKLAAIEGLEKEQIDTLRSLIDELVEVRVDEQEDAAAVAEALPAGSGGDAEVTESPEEDDESHSPNFDEEIDEELVCPECGAVITTDMTACPACGIGLSFEYEE
jgi:N utilization substance protein A